MRNDGFSSNGSKDYIRFFFTQLGICSKRKVFIFSRYFGWSIVILSLYFLDCLFEVYKRREVGC